MGGVVWCVIGQMCNNTFAPLKYILEGKTAKRLGAYYHQEARLPLPALMPLCTGQT